MSETNNTDDGADDVEKLAGDDGDARGPEFVTRNSFKRSEVGSTGLIRYGDAVDEEWHRALKGRSGVRVLREMRDNDSTIGSSFYAMNATMRQVPWTAQPANHPRGAEAAEFLTSCFRDMTHTYSELLTEALSHVWFGWALFEKVYKLRVGATGDARTSSRYNDGRIGIRNIAIRAQETLDGWEFDEDGSILGMYQLAAPKFERVFLDMEDCILFRTELSKNNPEGRTILRNAYRPWFFLKRLEEIEAIGIERDLVGLPVMELPISYFGAKAPQDKIEARRNYGRLISQIRRNDQEGVVIPAELNTDGKPSGYKLSLLSTGGTRAINIEAAIQRKAKAIGQVMLTHFIFIGMDGVGTQAAAGSFIDVFNTALGSILDSIEETLDRSLTAELMTLNGYPVESWPRWKHGDIQKADARSLAETILKLVQANTLTPDSPLEDFLRSELRLPERNDEDLPRSKEELDAMTGEAEARGMETAQMAAESSAAASLVDLTSAMAALLEIGDKELLQATRLQYAAQLGVKPPAELAPELLEKPDPVPVVVPGQPAPAPGAKPAPPKPPAKPA